MRRFLSTRTVRTPTRHAATLAEVLMSILIMSIGVVTLATLFPIAVLRSVQATQLTNATILRYNAEALIDAIPQLVFDPDADGNYNEHVTNPTARNYVVDPMGYYAMATLPEQGFFGNDGNGSQVGSLTRFYGGSTLSIAPGSNLPPVPFVNTEPKAADLATLPDSFVTQVTGTGNVSGTGATSLTFAKPNDVAALLQSVTTDGSSRIVIISSDGNRAVSRPVTGVSGTTVSWGTALPSTFGAGNYDAVVETAERRYSWLATVRRPPGGQTADIDIAVFFRRSFTQRDELVQPATVTNAANREITIGNPFSVLDGNTVIPPIKTGTYLLDVNRARWYRVQEVLSESPTTASVRVDRDFVGGNPTNVVIMRGIVEVYSIGKKAM